MATHPRLVAVGNLKGGTGKTTLAVNLACALGRKGSAIIVDADEQGTATMWAAAGNLPVPVRSLPLTADGPAGINAWIAEAVAIKQTADLVVIDCPPALGGVTVAALTLADLFVLPVTPSGMDIKAMARALELLAEARKARKGTKPAALLVPSRVDRRTAAGREIEAVLSDFGEPVAPAVAQRTAHVDAFSAGQWVGDYAPRSAAHTEIEALAALLKRILDR